jgi:hypothetical protein
MGNPETAIYHIGAVLDPLSEAAQKWSTFFEVRLITSSWGLNIVIICFCIPVVQPYAFCLHRSPSQSRYLHGHSFETLLSL